MEKQIHLCLSEVPRAEQEHQQGHKVNGFQVSLLFLHGTNEEISHIPNASTAVLGLYMVLHHASVLVIMIATREMNTSLEWKTGKKS